MNLISFDAILLQVNLHITVIHIQISLLMPPIS